MPWLQTSNNFIKINLNLKPFKRNNPLFEFISKTRRYLSIIIDLLFILQTFWTFISAVYISLLLLKLFSKQGQDIDPSTEDNCSPLALP